MLLGIVFREALDNLDLLGFNHTRVKDGWSGGVGERGGGEACDSHALQTGLGCSIVMFLVALSPHSKSASKTEHYGTTQASFQRWQRQVQHTS